MHHRLLLTIALLCAAVQGTWAEDKVTFLIRRWDGEKVVTKDTTITDYIEVPQNYNSSKWYGLGGKENKDYYYVVNVNAEFDVPLNVFGRVHLILCDNKTLTCKEGILVQKQDGNDPHLIIHSQISNDAGYDKMGSLVVTNSNKNWAAIGSSEAQDCGKITIQGGRVVATGAKYGAGIGAGACTSDAATKVGDITIFGGYVVAYGGASGAGIGGGGGYYKDNCSHGGNFTMYGGLVTTTGGDFAAGLGGGGGYTWYNDKDGPGGNGGKVYVYGGLLKAYGGKYGAGIGSGSGTDSEYSRTIDSGEVHIYGGTVKAYGGELGAGVGGGKDVSGADVHVSDGELYALGGRRSAGIGSGRDENINGGAKIENGKPVGLNGGSLEVTGGKVEAVGKSEGAGIGGGSDAAGAKVTIKGGTVEAYTYEFDISKDSKNEDPKAIGFGRLYSNSLSETEKSLLRGSLSIADNYMVTAATESGKRTDGVIPAIAANRISYCFERKYACIKACPHTAQEGDDGSTVTTYTINDDVTHTSHCRYCNHTETNKHVYDDKDVCVCGMGKTGTLAPTIKVYTGTDEAKYKLAQTDKVAVGRTYVLPKPADIEGFIFMGYLVATEATAPTTIEMKDADMQNTNSLLDAGQPVTVEADVCYYARYRYTYTEKWTWAEDYSSATLKISWIKNGVTFELSANAVNITDESKEPTADSEGYYRYIAQWVYSTDGFTYTFSDAINITRLYALSLADGSDNRGTLIDNNGSEVNTLTLTDRTLFKDNSWNTLCLPFDVSDGDTDDGVSFSGTPLEGADVRTLESSSFADGTLTLNFTSVNKIEAGKPYIVKWVDENNTLDDLKDPAFNKVNLSATDAEFIESDYVGFMGCFSPVSLEANDKTVLYLGDDNMLYYPSQAMTINSCRAYFKLKGLTAGKGAQGIRAFNLKFGEDGESTGISSIHSDAAASGWYSIEGRRLNGAPVAPGVYIFEGRKVMIK